MWGWVVNASADAKAVESFWKLDGTNFGGKLLARANLQYRNWSFFISWLWKSVLESAFICWRLSDIPSNQFCLGHFVIWRAVRPFSSQGSPDTGWLMEDNGWCPSAFRYPHNCFVNLERKEKSLENNVPFKNVLFADHVLEQPPSWVIFIPASRQHFFS